MPVVSIQDIAPPEVTTELVPIPRVEAEIEVRGISNKEMAALARRFPIIARQAAGVPIPPDEALIGNLDVMAPLIAAGLGKCGDKEVEKLVERNLTQEEKQLLLQAITRLTNPAPDDGDEARAPADGPFDPAAAAAANGADSHTKEISST